MRIDILDELTGREVTCVLHDGSELTAALRGVSHQDAFDVIILAGREPFRSTELAKLYVGEDLVWPEGAEDDSSARALARTADRVGFDPTLYERAISLLDRVVAVILSDGAQAIGRLEVVTPHVGENLPTLHLSAIDGDEIQVVQLGAATAIEIYALTQDEVDGIIEEEGQQAAEDEAEVDPDVDAQREQAEAAREAPTHSEEDTAAAFGITSVPDEQEEGTVTPDVPDDEAPEVESEDDRPLEEASEDEG